MTYHLTAQLKLLAIASAQGRQTSLFWITRHKEHMCWYKLHPSEQLFPSTFKFGLLAHEVYTTGDVLVRNILLAVDPLQTTTGTHPIETRPPAKKKTRVSIPASVVHASPKPALDKLDGGPRPHRTRCPRSTQSRQSCRNNIISAPPGPFHAKSW